VIKLGTSKGSVLLSVSQGEFKSLTGKVPSNVPDGTELSAESLAKIALVDAKLTELASIKAKGQQLIDELTAIGVQ
jgi:hypothetical protein